MASGVWVASGVLDGVAVGVAVAVAVGLAVGEAVAVGLGDDTIYRIYLLND